MLVAVQRGDPPGQFWTMQPSATHNCRNPRQPTNTTPLQTPKSVKTGKHHVQQPQHVHKCSDSMHTSSFLWSCFEPFPLQSLRNGTQLGNRGLQKVASLLKTGMVGFFPFIILWFIQRHINLMLVEEMRNCKMKAMPAGP